MSCATVHAIGHAYSPTARLERLEDLYRETEALYLLIIEEDPAWFHLVRDDIHEQLSIIATRMARHRRRVARATLSRQWLEFARGTSMAIDRTFKLVQRVNMQLKAHQAIERRAIEDLDIALTMSGGRSFSTGGHSAHSNTSVLSLSPERPSGPDIPGRPPSECLSDDDSTDWVISIGSHSSCTSQSCTEDDNESLTPYASTFICDAVKVWHLQASDDAHSTSLPREQQRKDCLAASTYPYR
ncbi:hypothetical protein PLICRDRAFT_58494 [Plicaturopsis crispa FD-325 SS-3]|uniref:Uncharacterized protein n=1 Tax=Plicaturopsis crispa FD-325 SS-3 TaxID=944288 RepID=A0A0C9SK82_PLICR|nr:hypothetical protein PLICRDRAFT_58494 [Plicaturopsis crispa FD-325 SS-3]